MPSRQVIAKELAGVFKVIAHPDRIRLIEELRDSEQDVNTLAATLDLAGARVSQHLALLRAHRIVEERREGRHHFYRLVQPEFARWIVDGLDFLAARDQTVSASRIDKARELWTAPPTGSAAQGDA